MSLEFPFSYERVESLSTLFYPTVELPIFTRFGWRVFTFVVDTGADITTLPSTIIPLLDLDTRKLEQMKIYGVGGISVPVWRAKINIKIGSEELEINVSIVQGSEMSLLLGKKDIFEKKYGLIVDSKKKVTFLKKNF